MSVSDPYAVLGVLPHAEDVVIRAAYRALANRYHPDRFQGDPKEAHARMTAINAAYAVLSDPEQRAAYDKANAAQKASYADSESPDMDAAFDSALGEVEERWTLACEIYPDLQALRDSLAKVSRRLAFGFVVACLEKRDFARRHALAQEMKRGFMTSFFGSNEQVLAFAARLIALGEQGALRHLNQLVDVMGSKADAKPLIDAVIKRHSLAEKLREGESAEYLEDLRRCVRSMHSFVHAVRLAQMMGYTVKELPGGWLSHGDVLVESPGGEATKYRRGEGFVEWVKRMFC